MATFKAQLLASTDKLRPTMGFIYLCTSGYCYVTDGHLLAFGEFEAFTHVDKLSMDEKTLKAFDGGLYIGRAEYGKIGGKEPVAFEWFTETGFLRVTYAKGGSEMIPALSADDLNNRHGVYPNADSVREKMLSPDPVAVERIAFGAPQMLALSNAFPKSANAGVTFTFRGEGAGVEFRVKGEHGDVRGILMPRYL